MKAVLRGIITDIFPVEKFTNFEKRVFWLKEPDTERYPNHWQIELHQKDASLIDKFRVEDVVTCSVDIKGRFFTNAKSINQEPIDDLPF